MAARSRRYLRFPVRPIGNLASVERMVKINKRGMEQLQRQLEQKFARLSEEANRLADKGEHCGRQGKAAFSNPSSPFTMQVNYGINATGYYE